MGYVKQNVVFLMLFFSVSLCAADKEHKQHSPLGHQPNKSQGYFKFLEGKGFIPFIKGHRANKNASPKNVDKDESKKPSHTIPNTPVDDLGFVNQAFDSMVVERGSRGSFGFYSMQYSSHQPGAEQQPGVVEVRKDSYADMMAQEAAFKSRLEQAAKFIKELGDQKDEAGEYLAASLLIKNLSQSALCVMLPMLVKAALTTNKSIRQLEGPEHIAAISIYWWSGQAATVHDENGQKELQKIAKKFSKKKYAMPNLKHKLERAYFVNPSNLKILREYANKQGDKVYPPPQDKIFDL